MTSSLDSDADSDCSTDDEQVGGTTSAKPKGKKRVLFANDVRFQSSKPRRSYQDRGDKIVKVNVKDRFENDNRVNELGFSMHNARLKAQMMTNMVQDDKPGDRRVYVRVPGSTKVREIIFYDGEDELHEYDIGPDESKEIQHSYVHGATDMDTFQDQVSHGYWMWAGLDVSAQS